MTTNTTPFTIGDTFTIGDNWTGGTCHYVPLAPAPPLPAAPPSEGWFKRALKHAGLRLASERGGTMPIMPRTAGASDEFETDVQVEHKKKITLERKVGVPRDKGSGMEEIHSGKLELVRTMEGTELQKSTIGLKCTPNGGSYVEIPVEKLREALDALDPPEEEQ